MANASMSSRVKSFCLDDKDGLLKTIAVSLADHNRSWSEHIMLERVLAQNIAIGLTDDERKIMADSETYEECALKIATVLGDHTMQRKERYGKLVELLVANGRPEMASKIGNWHDVTPDNYATVKDELFFVNTGLTMTQYTPATVPADSVVPVPMNAPVGFNFAFRSH